MKKYIYIIIFVVVGILFWLLSQYSFLYSDDWRYAFNMKTREPIKTVYDILESQSCAYMIDNGRFVIHSLVQFFCGIAGITLFSVFNAVFFVALCICFILLSINTRLINVTNVVLAICLLWLFFPEIGFFLGNISLSVNYLWSAAFVFAFIVVYTKLHDKQLSNIANICLFIFSFFVGSLQESFSIGVTGALFIYYCFNFKKLKGAAIPLVLGFFLGTCVLVLAPGNFYRLSHFPSDDVGNPWLKKIAKGALLIAQAKIFDVLVICTLWSWFRNKLNTKEFIINNLLLYMIICINVLFGILVVYTGVQQLICIELLSLVILFRMLITTRLYTKYIQYISILLVICTIITYIPAYQARREMSIAYKQFTNNALQSEDGIVVSDYESLYYNIPQKYNCIVRRYLVDGEKGYVATFVGMSGNKNFLSRYLTKNDSTNLIKTVLPTPKENIVEACNSQNEIIQNIYKMPDIPFWVMRIDANISVNNISVNISRRNKTIPDRIKNFYYKHKTSYFMLEKAGEDCDWFNYGDCNYIVIPEDYDWPIESLAYKNI